MALVKGNPCAQRAGHTGGYKIFKGAQIIASKRPPVFRRRRMYHTFRWINDAYTGVWVVYIEGGYIFSMFGH